MTDSQDTLVCVRCNQSGSPARGVTWGGSLGEEIRTKVCQGCWQEWLKAEVMVINELRLNFMDSDSQTILARHLREFLMLPS